MLNSVLICHSIGLHTTVSLPEIELQELQLQDLIDLRLFKLKVFTFVNYLTVYLLI